MKPTILIFIDWYKPGYKAGGPIRSVSNMVDALKDDFQFYIITRNTDYLETTPTPTSIPTNGIVLITLRFFICLKKIPNEIQYML